MQSIADTLAQASCDQRVLKAHGTGNDFVVVIDMDDDIELTPALVAALCDRHFGIGADGVIRITATVPADVSAEVAAAVVDAPVFMDYHNADGSIVQMCGNGVRVVAKIVHDHGVLPVAEGARLAIGTRAGMRPVTVMGSAGADGALTVAHVTVDMGAPVQDATAVGLTDGAFEGDVWSFQLHGDAIAPATTFAGMSMGNPHAVTVVADVDEVDLGRFGPAVETHPAFSGGVNVNVVQVIDDARLRLRVWERGVGETMACGTGACATVAVMAVAEAVDLDRPVDVDVPGGRLTIERDERGHLMMTGPVEVVATVALDPAWLEARLPQPTV